VRSNLVVCSVLLAVASALAQDSTTTVPHVSVVYPVVGASHSLSADRPIVAPNLAAGPRPRSESPVANSWKLLATLPGTVIHDLIFVSPAVGYAAAEVGQVWKTTNGGKTWTEVLNLGFPYYFYGVQAHGNDVVVSGFVDSSTQQEGVIRWSHDGGQTWSSDVILSTTEWLQRVRYANLNDGLILDLAGGTAQYTTDGGATASDWTTVIDNPDGAWFGLQFSFLPNLHARASGINFCTSLNGGATWTCGPSVDSVFDGPVLFQGDSLGWVGGGEIAPSVEGWVHITTDGGKSWSGRTLDGPWPIRQFVFINSKIGWATGGNLYTGVGGMYFTTDGGNTWSVDLSTGAEMDACTVRPLKTGHAVWCAGYNSSLTGVIYGLKTAN
jgi:photosystem II stability/assembly factor-like uncharacterized protein